MKFPPLVYVFGPGSLAYKTMFIRNGFRGSPNPLSADFLCLTGGADVCPSLYAEPTMKGTSCNVERDRLDIEISAQFQDQKKPMVGICRGGQFLNVMCGGKMWQNVDGHALHGTHELTDLETGQVHKVSSTHHQMMRPSLNALVIATAAESTKKVAAHDWWMANVSGNPKGFVSTEAFDTEVCLYSNDKALCFQPHPEYEGFPECEKYFFEVLKRYLDLAAAA